MAGVASIKMSTDSYLRRCVMNFGRMRVQVIRLPPSLTRSFPQSGDCGRGRADALSVHTYPLICAPVGTETMSAFIGIGTILVSARRVRALPIVGAMALFLGACAHN